MDHVIVVLGFNFHIDNVAAQFWHAQDGGWRLADMRVSRILRFQHRSQRSGLPSAVCNDRAHSRVDRVKLLVRYCSCLSRSMLITCGYRDRRCILFVKIV